LPERPNAIELLDVARETLLALDDEVEPRHRYELRMAASAMAIAAREIAASAPAGDDADLLRRAVGCDRGDRDAQRALHAALVAATRAKLVISNPRLLHND
jgi:hypothetical protein